MLNLMETLTKEDNILIEKYIQTHSPVHKNYIGNEKFLSEWAKNKKKLYHLLGGNLIVKFPFCYEKGVDDIEREISVIVDNHNTLLYCVSDTIFNLRYKVKVIEPETERILSRNITSMYIYKKNVVEDTIKFKYNSKTFQITKGMKPMKALQKFLDFFKDFINELYEECKIQYNYEQLKAIYEKFRIAQSLIYNEKIVKGNLALSIHPLDFLTMSNNASNWQSCMEWRDSSEDSGCYHVGTIEMMNSNNALCCYLESSQPYCFYMDADDDKNGREYLWNNKKWRVLAFITKDIIVTGKSYPYKNASMIETVLNHLKDLAQTNLKWDYKYGIERYQDMIHINSMYRIDQNRTWLHTSPTFKHNIIFDTKGMYNDMLNDNTYPYMCYRNKPKKMKIISISGKALCTCCGEAILYDSDNYDDDYNSRFERVDKDYCYDCEQGLSCSFCGELEDNLIEYDYKKICYDCFNERYRVCPDCGKIYSSTDGYSGYHRYTDTPQLFFRTTKIPNTFVYTTTNIRRSIYRGEYFMLYDLKNKLDNAYFCKYFACKECLEKKKKDFVNIEVKGDFIYNNTYNTYNNYYFSEDYYDIENNEEHQMTILKYSWDEQEKPDIRNLQS